nr:TIGR02301 family protein [uncultured Cohaesibacter sp.]
MALLLTLACSLCLTPVHAKAAENNLPPYEQSLRRLSAVVGALMFLDPLCNGSDPKDWYLQMAALLEAENADDTRTRQLKDRFNKSYLTYSSTYKSCNAQAKMITRLYHEEGQSLLTTLKLKHAR